MKNILLIAIAIILSSNIISGQSLNWNTIETNKVSQAYLNFGYDFGMTTQIGYAHRLNTANSVLLMSDISVPMGNKLDDYKFRIGAKMKVLGFNSFKTSVQYMSIIRRNETNLVRQIGIGQLFCLASGVYKDSWHAAFEVGYDGSVATHLKHSEELQSVYADIQDAWYQNTGGQWHVGLQASKQLKERIELNLRLGVTNARGEDVDALLPAYFDFGLVVFLGR